MMSFSRRRSGPPRRGVSLLEFLGCLSALAGGLILGSLYLGVDVKEMAFVVLEKAHVVEARPKPSQRAGRSPSPAPTAVSIATTTNPAPDAPPAHTAAGVAPSVEPPSPAAPSLDVATPAGASAAPPAATPAAPAAGLFARADLITPEQRQALTLAYWQALAACMQDEVQGRLPAVDAEGNWQLFDYLTGRKDGHLKAAGAIAALDARGVDDHVMAYAKKAHAWHQDGARLFARALDLLTDAPTAQLSGPFAQSWQSAATQHRMEARLLAEKAQAVRSYLDHEYAAAPPAETAAAVTAPAAAADAAAAGPAANY